MKTLSLIVTATALVFGYMSLTVVQEVKPEPLVLEEVTFNVKKYEQITGHITSLVPKINKEKLHKVALSIYSASEAHNVEPKFIVAIIMTESTFRQNVVSSTGDVSIAQINFNVWGKESKRLGFSLDKNRLKTDSNYAIHAMARILNLLQSQYKGKDPQWFAIYHSKTCKPDFCPKKEYAAKVSKHMIKWPETTSSLLAAN